MLESVSTTILTVVTVITTALLSYITSNGVFVHHKCLLDSFFAITRVLELLAGDLVEQVTQPLLDDVEGDLLPLSAPTGCALHCLGGQVVKGCDVPQHGHRLHTHTQICDNHS